MRQISFLLMALLLTMTQCRSTRSLKQIVVPVDSSVIRSISSGEDSLRLVDSTLRVLHEHHIRFSTFSAKVKVEAENSKGKQPDLIAVMKIVNDSAIWISITSTFLNIEVYRVLITGDSLILLNKQEKTVQYRSLDYIQEITGIPLDYKTLQDLLVGNPVYYSDSLISFSKKENVTLLSTRSGLFKHLLTLSNENLLLLHSKLDDAGENRHRTADISYGDFENSGGISFPTSRQILITENNRLDIRLSFKQFEFNKELSVSFNVPKNYKRN